MQTRNWPTREEWAKIQRALYFDRFEDLPVTTSLSAYATETEVATIVEELDHLYQLFGRMLKKAKQAAGSLVRQQGEGLHAYGRRLNYFDLPEPDRTLLNKVLRLKDWRRWINHALKEIRDDVLPRCTSPVAVHCVLEPTQRRYDAAWQKAHDKRRRQILSTPIDGEAWVRELERRQLIEYGGMVIHHVNG